MNILTRIRTRPFYLGLAVLISSIVLAGFWPSYFGPFIHGTGIAPVRIHVHAAVFVGWLILFLVQVVLAALGQFKWHRQLGYWGVGYGILVMLDGTYTAVARAALKTGEFYGPFMDMVIFALFFGFAIYYRRKPKWHRRLMVVAATMVLIAAVKRLWFLPLLPETLRTPVFFFIWFLPVVLAVLYDYLGKQRIHPIYILGILCFFFRQYSPDYVVQTEAWIAFKGAALSAYFMLGGV